MSDGHETIADLIAWLRKPREGENAYLTLWRDEIADRFEAAHRRELSKNTSKNGADFGQLGDAAKLREALRKINNLCGIGVVEISSFEIGSICDDALAATARNCDMQYNDRVEMYDAFKDWCNARGHTMDPKLAYDAFEWLLAPATEKEGGAK